MNLVTARLVKAAPDHGQRGLLAASFADALDPDMRSRLVSVGRYALRGVAQPQELFIPEPGFYRASFD